jgi:hypothetical protein
MKTRPPFGKPEPVSQALDRQQDTKAALQPSKPQWIQLVTLKAGPFSIRRAGRKLRPTIVDTRGRLNSEGLHRTGSQGVGNASLPPNRSPKDRSAAPLTSPEHPFERGQPPRLTRLQMPLAVGQNSCSRREPGCPKPPPIPVTTVPTADRAQRHGWLEGYSHSPGEHKRKSPSQKLVSDLFSLPDEPARFDRLAI